MNPANSFAEWLNTVTAGLDRKIRQRLELELSAHYEDAYNDFLNAGLRPDEAARRALENLGEAQAAREVFRGQYTVETPWESEFLPKKLENADYGYLKGNKLIACSREELLEACQGAGINVIEVKLAWTPETRHAVPVETIPFLFQAIKDKRLKQAKFELFNCAGLAALFLGPYFSSGEPSNLRHLMLFLGLVTVVPAVVVFKHLRAARALTPEILAKEVGETNLGFRIWIGLQKARFTIALVIACSVVGLMQLVAFLLGGSFENAALVKGRAISGEWWRLLTAPFVSSQLLFHAIGLIVFGSLVELAVGRMFVPIVFLVSVLSASVFSLLLNPVPSVGALSGILGFAGFLFTSARQQKAVLLPGVQQTASSVALFAAVAGIVVYDLFDSAAHLGGLLAGLATGWAIKDPKKISSTRAFQIVGIVSCALLVGAAVLASLLVLRPAPKTPVNRAPSVEIEIQLPSKEPGIAFVHKTSSRAPDFPTGPKPA